MTSKNWKYNFQILIVSIASTGLKVCLIVNFLQCFPKHFVLITSEFGSTSPKINEVIELCKKNLEYYQTIFCTIKLEM